MRAVVKKNDEFYDKIIEEHREALRHKNVERPSANDRMDFVDVLLTSPYEGNDNKPLNNSQIKAILMILILGGTDTSVTTVEWAMKQLLRYPDKMKKAQDELDAVVGRDRLVEETDIPNLQYIRAVLMESLRLHPAAPILLPQYSTESCEVAGYHIPANVLAFVNTWAIGRDPAVWERPLEFEPERFLGEKKDQVKGSNGFEFLPFGFGRRTCPGQGLGILAVEYALVAFLQAFHWELPPGVKPEDLDFTEAIGITHAMAVQLEAIPSPRLPVSVMNHVASL